MWNNMRSELREVVWLASVVGGLSVLGVAAGSALAAALPVLLSRVQSAKVLLRQSGATLELSVASSLVVGVFARRRRLGHAATASS